MVEGELASRLTRLAGRAVRLSSSSDEETGALGGGSGGPVAPGAAAQALRQLLEHTAGDLSHLQRNLQMGGWLSRPERPSSSGGGGEAAQPRHAALEQAEAAPAAAHGAAESERSFSSHSPVGSGQGVEQRAQGSGEISAPTPANGGCAGSSDALEVSGRCGAVQLSCTSNATSRTQFSRPPAAALSFVFKYLRVPVASQALELGGLEEELRRQAQAEAQRQQARKARERELQQMQLACAQQHLAACESGEQSKVPAVRFCSVLKYIECVWWDVNSRASSCSTAKSHSH